jgi:hypothetical protein
MRSSALSLIDCIHFNPAGIATLPANGVWACGDHAGASAKQDRERWQLNGYSQKIGWV